VAVGIIKGSLTESQLGHVMGIRDAKEVWDTLKGIHETTDDARVQNLIADFIQFRMNTTIDDAASTLTRLQSEIGTLDSESKPSDAVKVQTLLASLGLEYEPTLAALQASKMKKFEEVVAQLRMAETRLRSKSTIDPQQARFTSAGRRGNAKKSDNGTENVEEKRKCFHCGKTGHFIRECEDFLNEIRQKILGETERSKDPPRALRAWSASHEGEHEVVRPW